MNRDDFVRAMAEKLGDNDVWAELVLTHFLASEGIEYGDPGYEWTVDEARELANVELSYGDDG